VDVIMVGLPQTNHKLANMFAVVYLNNVYSPKLSSNRRQWANTREGENRGPYL